MNASRALVAVAVVVIIVLGGAYVGFDVLNAHSTNSKTSDSGKVQVVAAENFWGSLVSLLGGTRVQVLSIVNNPNVDPHEYEASAADAQAIANANLVIVNGAGYDEWALLLISADNNPNQTVLNVQQLLALQTGVNPHFWYSPYYVNDTVGAMYRDLVSIDPSGAAYYRQQYAALNSSLWTYMSREVEIRRQFAGTNVASTESIFQYMANATGLNLVSPPAFMEAVAEGNDPPAQSIVQFQQQLQADNGSYVKVLVYNEQTVTPLTQNMKSLAAQEGIPILGVTETVQPPDVTFPVWMNSELLALQNALNANALGQG